jgi:hypothetical protein
MYKNDPRIDPRVGDITKNQYGQTFKITGVNNGGFVRYEMREEGTGRVEIDALHLDEWKEASRYDTIVHAEEGEKTGWVRYWICDKSGSGKDKWEYLYIPGCEDFASCKDYIIECRESWAMHADSFTMEIEINVVPPKEEVHIAIEHFETLAKDYSNIANKLKASIGM